MAERLETMPLRGLNIHYKIVLPFMLVSTGAMLITALVSVSVISRTLESRLQRQIERASAMIAQTDFALNRSILDRLKQVVDADILTYGPTGDILATTLEEEADRRLVDEVRSPELAARVSSEGQSLLLKDIVHEGRAYRVAYRPLGTPPGAVVAFIAPMSDLAETERAITRTVWLVAVLSLLVMALVSHLVARSVTAPVLRLAEFTRSVALRGPTEPPPVTGQDEIGRLAGAFSEMVAQLRESEEKLLRSEKLALTGLLAARVAHDVRNPLSSIKMQAQLLRTRLKPGADTHELLQAILREIDQVEWVVKGLLELARPGELHPEPAQVNEVVAEVLHQVGPQLRHRKITVDTQFDETLPPTLMDVDRVKQALLNLIVNAADAMPNGGTLLATTAAGADRMTACIDICDDGVGIDVSIRDRLFDPFVSTKREGVGLGLVNTKSIIERHGGAIQLVPRDGQGTRARIVLPIRSAETGAAGQRDLRPGDSETAHHDGGHPGRR